MSYSQRFRQAMHRASPGVKRVGKFIIINAISLAPGGMAGWAVKSVAYRPLRLLLAVVLEPLLSHMMGKISARFFRESRGTTVKRNGFTGQTGR